MKRCELCGQDTRPSTLQILCSGDGMPIIAVCLTTVVIFLITAFAVGYCISSIAETPPAVEAAGK